MKIIHPFDLIKISDDWFPSLKKSSSEIEPSFVGQIHPTKPYVAIKYVSPLGSQSPHHGRIVWSSNNARAKEDDEKLKNFLGSTHKYTDHPEDAELLKSFIQSIIEDPMRHVRKSFDEENHPRARHFINHLISVGKGAQSRMINIGGNRYVPIPKESQIAYTNTGGGRTMIFQALRHKEEYGNKNRVDHFVFSERGAKAKERAKSVKSIYINKNEEIPEIANNFKDLKFNQPPIKKVA